MGERRESSTGVRSTARRSKSVRYLNRSGGFVFNSSSKRARTPSAVVIVGMHAQANVLGCVFGARLGPVAVCFKQFYRTNSAPRQPRLAQVRKRQRKEGTQNPIGSIAIHR